MRRQVQHLDLRDAGPCDAVGRELIGHTRGLDFGLEAGKSAAPGRGLYLATVHDRDIIGELTRRYQGASLDALASVLCPLLIPIASLDKTVVRRPGEGHWRATFTVKIAETNQIVMARGRTGKFVPNDAGAAGLWREIAKGRLYEVDFPSGTATGEVYVSGNKEKLKEALEGLTLHDFWEVDQYGAAAKVLSALSEYYLVKHAQDRGYQVTRMPEDMARHLGAYPNFDFVFTKDGIAKRVESKSLWGTNTRHARLIHSTTSRPAGAEKLWTEDQRKNYYPTSSCKFRAQDIFAVSLFLRTGRIEDVAFARSVPQDEAPYGLPRCGGYREHVHQNPRCEIDNKVWFASIDDVWNLA